MSWSILKTGQAATVARDVRESFDKTNSYDASAEQKAVTEGIAATVDAFAAVEPTRNVIVETNGHIDKRSSYGTLSLRTVT